MRAKGALAFSLLLVGPAPAVASSAMLSFRERIEAQRVIERVYYGHQLGARRSFVQAVPEEVLEKKVLKYLRESVALQERWGRPITAGDLLEEWRRIKESTKLPMRLEELYEALGRDPALFQECFIRPVLADRLVRIEFARDPLIHRSARHEAERLRFALTTRAPEVGGDHDRLNVELEGERAIFRSPQSIVRETRLGPDEAARWRSVLPDVVAAPSELIEGTGTYEVRVLTAQTPDRLKAEIHRVAKISWDRWWAAVGEQFDHTRVQPVAGSVLPPSMASGGTAPGAETTCGSLGQKWKATGTMDVPEARGLHTAVWTGNLMIVWGGLSSSSAYLMILDTGGRYDPLTNTWTPTSTIDGPSARDSHSAVWTGNEMIIWGGEAESGDLPQFTGGRYEPISDQWVATSTNGAPAARLHHTAVWTGSEMIVWGGAVLGGFIRYFNDGGLYNPANDTWRQLSTMNAPSARHLHTAVWTGSRMIVWGGGIGTGLNTGGVYDPAANSWSASSTLNAPMGRFVHTAIWSGTEMIVWGGCLTGSADCLQTGGRYDPGRDEWSSTSGIGAASARGHHTATWTGSRMIIWGGLPGTVTGGIYEPIHDTWVSPTVVDDEVRAYHTAVWTGSEMIAWSGLQIQPIATGGRLALGPEEIDNLRWQSSGAMLEWDADSVTTTIYDLMSGDMDDVALLGASTKERCLADGLAATQFADNSPAPPPGKAWFFLVRGANGAGTGTYGCTSSGQERVTPVCP